MPTDPLRAELLRLREIAPPEEATAIERVLVGTPPPGHLGAAGAFARLDSFRDAALAGLPFEAARAEAALREGLERMEEQLRDGGECGATFLDRPAARWRTCRSERHEPHRAGCPFAALARPPSAPAAALQRLRALPGSMRDHAAGLRADGLEGQATGNEEAADQLDAALAACGLGGAGERGGDD